MTGFAAAGREVEGKAVNVTIRAVNHRFLDVALKLPQALAPLEAALRGQVQKALTRGRIEVTVSLEQLGRPEREVVVDDALLDRLAEALSGARDRGVVTGGLTAGDVLRLPQAVEIRAPAGDAVAGEVEPAMAELVQGVLGEALAALVTMRDTEGAYLRRDFEARLATLAGHVDALETQGREGQSTLEARLKERLATLPAELLADPAAQAQEVVRFVARSDVDEELVRMRGHLEHWTALADGAEPCGRKLDFLVQEMNRELNTIGSKIEGAATTGIVIDAKAELERVREQVQNVE